MKNTSILIPIILIACLVALALLITKAFAASEQVGGRPADPIVLNEEDYRDEEEDNFDSYYQEVPEDEIVSGSSADVLSDDENITTEEEEGFENERLDDYVPASPADAEDDETSSSSSSSNNGSSYTADGRRYLVIAGTFRQLNNAQSRVSSLLNSGFSDTSLERFDRGTFAVALAGRSDSYNDASQLAGRIRAAGYEAQVMRKR